MRNDGVNIDRLSPCARGIVLLMLYLAIDAKDNRSLNIDQPDENCFLLSDFNEPMPVFREAKRHRQNI